MSCSPKPRIELPLGLSITEAIAILTLSYFWSVACFNSGYFSKLPNRYVELFSFSDLVSGNIPIIQYTISLYFSYSMLSIFWVLPGKALRYLVDRALNTAGARKIIMKEFPNWVDELVDLFFIIFFAAAAIAWGELLEKAHNKIFTFEFAPWSFFYWVIFNSFFMSYRQNKIYLRTVIIQAIIFGSLFCHISGALWAKYEIRDEKDLQSFVLRDGLCVDRKLLRSASSGYLLYSPQLKQFEFREKSSIQVIYGNSGCT